MATTPRWALRYPLGTDAPDVPLWMERLATDLDDVAMDHQALSTDPVPASWNRAGSYLYQTDTKVLLRHNGSAWVAVNPTTEAWRTVGGVGQPAYENGWNASGTGANFYKAGSEVRLGGRVSAMPASRLQVMFTLPVGYRPFVTRRFSVAALDATVSKGTKHPVSVEVTTAGAVRQTEGNDSLVDAEHVYLDGIAFRAEA